MPWLVTRWDEQPDGGARARKACEFPDKASAERYADIVRGSIRHWNEQEISTVLVTMKESTP